ncbi:MAG TPA: hypothetical protein PKD86_05570 [Gemmatales bacterium]|nr:hypothetical protein [Gemmatales bacterium]HMP58802.1 hypothetical protein [Gemmatales bacterium]
MSGRKVCSVLIILGLACGGLAWAQDGKDETPQARLRGQLPANYKKLGLSEEQVQKIYKIQNDYDVKLRALDEQIKKLKAQQRSDVEKVLTTAQRARLKEIQTGDEKKSDDDKKDDQ